MCAMRGRTMIKQERSDYGKQVRKAYEAHEINDRRCNMQQFEIRKDGVSNTITTVGKDYLTIAKVENMAKVEDYLVKDYGVFKLSPRECGRLMNVCDDDIDKILSSVSNTQAYKQFGNSIVVACLAAIFSQLNIKGITPWNEMTDDERYNMIYRGLKPNGESKNPESIQIAENV